MITILIFVIVGIIVALTRKTEPGFEIIDRIFATLIGIALGFMFGLIVALSLPAKTDTIKKTIYLECLNDNNITSGKMFLGSGTVNGVWMYTYYYRSGDSYYLDQINASGTAIKYTNGIPRIEWYVERMSEIKGINLFAVDNETCSPKVIYIPIGSIQQNYNLDAN